jgi:hypothetical protein
MKGFSKHIIIWAATGNWSRVTKYICSSSTPNLLSTLDPASLASGIAAAFNSRTEAKQFASLAAQMQKTPEGVLALGRLPGIEPELRVPQTPVITFIP